MTKLVCVCVCVRVRACMCVSMHTDVKMTLNRRSVLNLLICMLYAFVIAVGLNPSHSNTKKRFLDQFTIFIVHMLCLPGLFLGFLMS